MALRTGGGSIPAWWWQPATEVLAQHEEMTALLCYRLEVPVGSTYAAGAAVLMGTLADQTSFPWPDEFPRKIAGDEARRLTANCRRKKIATLHAWVFCNWPSDH
jgi:hypothetical protein